ncbi:hypothetical protein [Paraburkholderia sp.]|jgi:hypothetical protein|uniref:hypothetical protein n=1 Tax=Paraburkholderia sp. TaxID=1926495 RepID=UPI002F406CBD
MATETYAGRTQDDRAAARTGAPVPAQEQPGGKMAVEGTQPDPSHSCGELSDEGKRAWQQGNTIGGKPAE